MRKKLRKSVSEFRKLLVFLVKPAALAGILSVIFLLLATQIKEELSGLFAVPVQAPPPAQTAAPSAAPVPEVSNGSFTELFSGVGWKNKGVSTAHQDLKTTVISFPPAYVLEEAAALSSGLGGETVVAAEGNGKEVVLATASGKILEFRDENGFRQIGQTAVPVSEAVLDYDEKEQTWVIAAVAGGSVAAGPVGLASSIGHINPASPMSMACSGGECLLAAGLQIYNFSIDKPSAAYAVALPKAFSPVSLSAGKVNGILLIGGVEKENGAYRGDIFVFRANLPSACGNSCFVSEYPGAIRFGYDSEQNEVLAVYAAYIGQAKLLSMVGNQSSDFSRFFPQRVMEGRKEGDEPVDPDLFFKDGAWWVGSSAKSPAPKLMRVESGIANDLTDEVLSSMSLSPSRHFLLVPGFGNRQVYIIADNRVFRLTDRGFDMKNKVVWESIKLNPWDGGVIRGALARADESADGGTIKYFLSPDGGRSWTPAKLGESVDFAKYGKAAGAGGDFRFRVELYPGRDAFQSPWVDTVGVEYSVKRKK